MADIEKSASATSDRKRFFVELAVTCGVFAVAFLFTLFAFLPSLGGHFLLDEQFIAAWSKALFSGTAAGGWGSYFSWSGPDAQDAFGPIGALSTCLMSIMGAGLARFISMTIHAACSTALYMVARRFTQGLDSKISLGVSIAAALLFAIHPLSAELINFTGASGIELSVFFFALSFNYYLAAHPLLNDETSNSAKKYSFLSVIFFVCTYLAYSKSWYLVKIIAMFEILNFLLDGTQRTRYKQLFKDGSIPGRKQFFATLGALFLLSIAFMGFEFAKGNNPVGAIAGMFPAGFKSMLLSLLFPINRLLLKKYSVQYITLDVIYAVSAALAVGGLILSKRYRVATCTALAWVIFGILVGGKDSVVADDFYGHRFLAHAQAGICLLIPLMAAGLATALNQWKENKNNGDDLSGKTNSPQVFWLCFSPAILLCLILGFNLAKHSNLESAAYKSSSKLLSKIQKSALITCAKANSPYCVVKDLPRRLAIVSLISPFLPMVIDGKSGLVRARTISGGALKDALAAGQLSGSVVRWDSTFDSLIPIVIDPKANNPEFKLDASGIAASIYPPIQYWKTVSLDTQNQFLSVASNSEHEPGISIFSRVLSPIDGDAFYIDAKIQIPIQPANPNVELNWMTLNTNDFEREDRRTVALAKLSSSEFERHILSLRGTGWVTNGPPTQLTIGFPSSSSVQIKGMGIVDGKEIFPTLLEENGGKVIVTGAKESRFSDLCFDYPSDAHLGLAYIDKNNTKLDLHFDTSAIAGSAKCVLYCGQKDQLRFSQDSGELPKTTTFKDDLNGTSGTLAVGIEKFPKTGIYGLRVLAQDANGNAVGKFSDTIWLLVNKN